MPRVAEATYGRSETRNEIGLVTVLGIHSDEKLKSGIQDFHDFLDVSERGGKNSK